MKKLVSPVVSVVLLVILTVSIGVGAYFFFEEILFELQGSVDGDQIFDNSNIRLLSVTGSKMIIMNDGLSPINDILILINNEPLNFTLQNPILPEGIIEINYPLQLVGVDLTIKIFYNKKNALFVSPKEINTENSGFVNDYNPIVINASVIANSTHLLGYCTAFVFNSSIDSEYYYEWLLNGGLNASGIILGNHDYENFFLSDVLRYSGSWIFRCMVGNGELNSTWKNSLPFVE